MSQSELIFTSSHTISDVNELASDIGRECERLISIYGSENTNEIVAKCIEVLEMLETLMSEREKLNDEIRMLKEKIQGMECRKSVKEENQKAFEKVKKRFWVEF